VVDAATGAVIWAELFDREVADLFGAEDEVTRRIAIALDLEMIADEAARPAANPDAFDYILRGRAILMEPISRANYEAAIADFERALALDPASAEAKSLLASVLACLVMDFHPPGSRDYLARAASLISHRLARYLPALNPRITAVNAITKEINYQFISKFSKERVAFPYNLKLARFWEKRRCFLSSFTVGRPAIVRA
jgi:hypothetical protein